MTNLPTPDEPCECGGTEFALVCNLFGRDAALVEVRYRVDCKLVIAEWVCTNPKCNRSVEVRGE